MPPVWMLWFAAMWSLASAAFVLLCVTLLVWAQRRALRLPLAEADTDEGVRLLEGLNEPDSQPSPRGADKRRNECGYEHQQETGLNHPRPP
jgi:hypothetical protein